VLALCTGAADAHAQLDHADPRVGNTVKRPRSVSLWFTQNLERVSASFQVLDAGKAVGNQTDRKLLRVPVKALGPGPISIW
jgi:copper resistance protein C